MDIGRRNVGMIKRKISVPVIQYWVRFFWCIYMIRKKLDPAWHLVNRNF